ncbi:MAG TPA: hypothetical protein VG267_09805 [Terracidiphilus sp.]|nr:hypothetical protein [Terracidiphilus sp.]
MEADWEFEIGPDAPVIDAAWPGLVDLRDHPDRIREIGETLAAGLAPALLRLNSPASPVWTAKCDMWEPGAVDPDEMDATAGEAAFARACYIDLLPREGSGWSGPSLSPSLLEAFCRRLCAALKAIPARNCRVDLVARRAILHAGREALGITAYLTACGSAEDRAAAALAAALAALADSCSRLQWGQQSEEKLQ